MGKLDVVVVEGRKLIKCEIFSEPDPYVVLKLEGSRRVTKHCRSTCSPKWSHQCSFNVRDHNSSQLLIEVWNKNPIKDDFMGKYNLSLSGLTQGIEQEFTVTLGKVKSGEIVVRLTAVDFGLPAPQASVPSPTNTSNPYTSSHSQQSGTQANAQQPSYPPQQQPGYPPQPSYPPQQQPGYPPQPSYPPQQQPGYPPQPSYPPQQQPGYPPQPSYPPQQQPGYPMTGPFGVQYASGIPAQPTAY